MPEAIKICVRIQLRFNSVEIQPGEHGLELELLRMEYLILPWRV